MSIPDNHNVEATHTYYLIIPHADRYEYRVLVQQTDSHHWILPAYQSEAAHFSAVAHINQFVAQMLGLFAVTLRCFHINGVDANHEERYYALDNLHAEWDPPEGWYWLAEDEIRNATFLVDHQRTTLFNWFSWCHSNSSRRSPWMRHGWYDLVANWMIDLADRLALEDVGQVEQVQVWTRAATMRLPTSNGTLYLKAVSEIFNYEPVVTRLLSIRFPGYVPDVQAVHVDHGWMLMRDFGGTLLENITDLEIWKAVLRRFGEIQIDLVGDTQSLISLGVPDRNVDYLSTQIARIANDVPDDFSDQEAAELKMMASTMRSMCFDLVEHNVPLTMTHGDLRPNNIIVKEDGTVLFFDWSDAAISHPFFDIPIFLTDVAQRFSEIPDAYDQLRDTYLETWSRYEPMINLRRVFQLAEVLGSLHQALFYYVHILPAIEADTRWELQNMLADLLRHSLQAAKEFRRK